MRLTTATVWNQLSPDRAFASPADSVFPRCRLETMNSVS